MDSDDEVIGTQAFFYESAETHKLGAGKDEKDKVQVGELCANGKKYPIYKGTNIIGREPSCDVYLDCATVSKNHAEIEADDYNSVFICDISSNGTLLNNQLLKKHRSYQILHGNIIQFGEIHAKFNNLKNEDKPKITETPTKTTTTTPSFDLDISSIPCSQAPESSSKLNENTSAENIIGESSEENIGQHADSNNLDTKTETLDKSSPGHQLKPKPAIFCETENSNDDMFDDIFDTDTEKPSAIEHSSEKSVSEKHSSSGFEDESIFDAETQKFPGNATNFGTPISNKFKADTSSASHSTPINKNHKFVIPETPILLSKSIKSFNASLPSTTKSSGNTGSIHDQSTLQNSQIEQYLNSREIPRNNTTKNAKENLLHNDSSSIFDAPTQCFKKTHDAKVSKTPNEEDNVRENDIYDAETQKFGEPPSSLATSIHDAPTQPFFREVTEKPIPKSQIKVEICTQEDKLQETNKKLNLEEDDGLSDGSADLLDSEMAKEFMTDFVPVNESGVSIFDAATQKIDNKNSGHKKDLCRNENSNLDESVCLLETQNAKDFFNKKHDDVDESIFDAPTQKILPKKGVLGDKDASSDSDTDEEGTFKDVVKPNSTDIHDAATQKIYHKDNHVNLSKPENGPRCGGNTVLLDEDDDIFDALTQKISREEPGKSNEAASDSSETDEDGEFSNDTAKKSSTDIHDIVTQKIDHKKPQNVAKCPEEIVSLDDSIFDAPTQKIPNQERKGNYSESDSDETDEEGSFSKDRMAKSNVDIHNAETQKLPTRVSTVDTKNVRQDIHDEDSNDSVDLLDTQNANEFLSGTNLGENIFDAPTQKIIPLGKPVKSSNEASDEEETDEEGTFLSQKTVSNNADIHNAVTQKIVPKVSMNKTNPVDSAEHENSNSNDSMDLLDTQNAKEFLSKNAGDECLYDAPTQKIVRTTESTKTDAGESDTDEEGTFSSKNHERNTISNIHEAETQPAVRNEVPAIKNDRSNIIGNTDFISSDNVFDAPTQKIVRISKSTKTNAGESDSESETDEEGTFSSKTVPQKTSIDIHEADTQKVAAKGVANKMDSTITLDDDDSNASENLFDAPTQKMEPTPRPTKINIGEIESDEEAVFVVKNVPKKASILEAEMEKDSNSNDALTQKMERPGEPTKANAVESDSETDEEGTFSAKNGTKITADVPKANTQKTEKTNDHKNEHLKTSPRISNAVTQKIARTVEPKPKSEENPVKTTAQTPSTSGNSSKKANTMNNSVNKSLFVHCSDSESDFYGFDDVNEGASKPRPSVSPDLLSTQKMDQRTDPGVTEIDDEDFDLPATQIIERKFDYSASASEIEDANASAVEGNLRNLLGESQPGNVEEPLPLMTQQLVDLLEPAEPQKLEDPKSSPIIAGRMRLSLSRNLSFKKSPAKLANETIETNLRGIMGEPQNASFREPSSQMMTQQIINVLESSQSEHEVPSPEPDKAKRGKNVSARKNPRKSGETSQPQNIPQKQPQKKETEVASPKPSASSKRTGTKRKVNESKPESVPKSKIPRRTKASSPEFETVPNDVPPRPSRKRKTPPKDPEESEENADSQNYYRSLKSKRKVNVLTESQDYTSNDEASERESTRPKRKAAAKKSPVKPVTRGSRSKTKSKDETANLPKITSYFADTSRSTRSTRTSSREPEPQPTTSGTIRLSLTKKNEVWESVSISEEPKNVSGTKKKEASKRPGKSAAVKSTEEVAEEPPVKKPRGRPRKAKKEAEPDSLDVGEDSQEVRRILNSWSAEGRQTRSANKEPGVSTSSGREVVPRKRISRRG